MIRVGDAVASLRPNTEWLMSGDDVDTIVWYTPDVEPVTRAQVDKEIERLTKAEEAAAVTAATNAAAAIAHAKSLGFTDAMISAMYPGLNNA